LRTDKFSIEEAEPCITCGFCRDGCPISRYFGFEPQLIPILRFVSASILGNMGNIDTTNLFTFSDDLLNDLYLCTSCGYCKQVCPNQINLASLIEKSRHELREGGLEARKVYEDRLSQIKRENNPYGELNKDRVKWLNELDFQPPKEADTIFFVGCTSTYRRKEIALSSARVLHHAGVDFGYLGEEEPCCGSVLIRTGFPDQAKDQAEKNLKALRSAKEVITACAGCYRTFQEDYPEMVGSLSFKLIHTTEYISNLIQSKKISLGRVDIRVTYHDPCHLARACNIYDPPREILKAIPGIELVEMYPTKHASWCCGAGGGVKMAFPVLAVDIASEKIKLASEVGVEAIVTACPFCTINLKDAAKDKLQVYNIEEIVAKSIANAK